MLELAIEAARETGKILKHHIGRPKQVEHKLGQETNLVTEIDRKAEETILRIIKSRYPAHDVLAEESGKHNQISDYRWIIDPLDGTINFTHGVPIFCVSIALEYKGEIVLGVIYDPNLDELFVAERGRGASLNNRPIRVSTTNNLRESLLVTGFPYDISVNPDHAIERFVAFLKEARAVRRLGSAALDLCYVAAGRFDGFWEVYLNPWDMAAGVLLVQEAGGTYTDFRGYPSSIYDKQILASNGLIHESMIQILKGGNRGIQL